MTTKADFKPYRVYACFDIETTNVYLDDGTAIAYPILTTVLETYQQPISEYAGKGTIHYFRHCHQFLEYVDTVIHETSFKNYIPVFCAYNLMFDLWPYMRDLRDKYEMKVIAQASTNVYTLDILNSDNETILRFWDVAHLEKTGLARMGEIVGHHKTTGWDYELTRTPETELTSEELEYAAADVEIIPLYLKYLIESNEWLTDSMLGSSVLTKTSIVRQLARRTFGKLPTRGKWKLYRNHLQTAVKELPADFNSYGLRKACFRGGFTFTSGTAAHQVKHSVASLDAVSMHHFPMNGQQFPVGFQKVPLDQLEDAVYEVLSVDYEYALENYHKPFPVAGHFEIRFKNLRLKNWGEEWQIGLLSQSKFGYLEDPINELNVNQVNSTRKAGYTDYCDGDVKFVFNKLYYADYAILNVTEQELFCMSLVYSWDKLEVLDGEITHTFEQPPTFVTLQSNYLYEQKNVFKTIVNNYVQGQPYTAVIPEVVPDGMREKLRDGTLDSLFLKNYYTISVKGSYNGIYGTQAQDIFRKDHYVDENALILVDETKTLEQIFYDKLEYYKENPSPVIYTYGMRIVGGSRVHLCMAIETLWRTFGTQIHITGGDTDSLKISAPNISNTQLLDALEPLHAAVDQAIEINQTYMRSQHPGYASQLENIGHFEIETIPGQETTRYSEHMELWNKARISRKGDKFYITMAGIGQRKNQVSIRHVAENMWQNGVSFNQIGQTLCGYNTEIGENLSHILNPYHPIPGTIFDSNVTDYMGNTSHVCEPACVALRPSSKDICSTTVLDNQLNLQYLENEQGLEIDSTCKTVEYIPETNQIVIKRGVEVEYVQNVASI